MQQDVFIGSEPTSLPVEIRYEGGDAESHKIEMAALAESLDGFSRVYAVVGHFVATGEYAKQMQALCTRAFAHEPQAKCFSVGGALAWASSSGIFQGLAAAVFGAVLSYVYSRNTGSREEMKHLRELFERQLGFNHEISERMMDTVDRLADALKPSVKKSVAPIGQTCDRIDLYSGGAKSRSIDGADKDAILSEKETQILPEKEYSVIISEMDRMKRTCKVSFTEPDSEENTEEDGTLRRFLCEITDPVATLDDNPYLKGFASGKPVDIKAKAVMREGLIVKLFISDAR